MAPIQHLTLEIIDYPGEWLLDLPLLGESFEGFSASALELAQGPLRAPVAAAWLERLRGFDADGPEDEEAIAALAAAYTAYLKRCHEELGLSLVQPGRFTNPGELEGSELLQFCPLPPGAVRPGTNRARMAERFEIYREEVVPPLLRGAFQPLRPADRAGRPDRGAERRPLAFRRHRRRRSR